MNPTLAVHQLLDLAHTLAADLFDGVQAPWAVLPLLAEYIRQRGPSLSPARYEQAGPELWIARDASVAASASIGGPAIIDAGAEIRHCAFIRGSAVIGRGAVVGNATEVKNALLFDGAQVPHYNYIGDSVLGYLAHMGAGAITSNVKSDKSPVSVQGGGMRIETGLRKFGAVLGDRAEVGCNAVLCPGTVIGRDSIVYPTVCVRGALPAWHILKDANTAVSRRREG